MPRAQDQATLSTHVVATAANVQFAFVIVPSGRSKRTHFDAVFGVAVTSKISNLHSHDATGLHDCDTKERVDPVAYAANLKGVFETLKPAVRDVFVLLLDGELELGYN
jgi:hypothetical protein